MVFGFGKKYKCDACGAKFSTEAELKEHAKVHAVPSGGSGGQTQAMAFKCSQCSASFATQAELTEHAKVHQKT
ncbi:MAG TPA: C2H2-type zinc finger protein [Nitrososphaerales archaeon]|nr:C2H2-type zinc finger protein [Nitrososphaerales archaeon]